MDGESGANEKGAGEKVAVSAGRGVLFIAAAKMYFMVAGAAIEFILPRLLGRFLFGAYGVVTSFVNPVNGFLVTGTIQAVSRYTTEQPERAAEVRGAGFRMHLMLGLPLAVLFAVAAPLMAWLQQDMSKAGPIALAAIIILVYSFYSVLVGSANGQRAFHKQAGLDMTASTLRAIAILGAAAAGAGLWGVIGGWAAAAIGVFLVAAFWVGLPKGVAKDRVGPMSLFLLGVAGYLIIMQLISTADQLLLKPLATTWFREHPDWLARNSAWFDSKFFGSFDLLGLIKRAAAHESDGQVGFYRAVQNLARLPYQLMIAVTFVIFPLVSKATFEGDAAKTRSYIRTTLRYSLIFAAAMGTALAANPTANLDIVYTSEYALEGGAALAILAMGNVAFAVFTIAGTILNGAGRTLDAVVVAVLTLALTVAALLVGLPRMTPGHDMLLMCAAATAGAMIVGSIVFGAVLWRRFGTFVPALTLVRVAAAVGAAFGVARLVPHGSPIVTLGEAAASVVVYMVVLIVTGELGRADLRAVLAVAGKGKGK
jgi:O-antigen/teichoic acid export membrane protein